MRKWMVIPFMVALLMGISMSVCAANYTQEQITNWKVLHGGDTITFEAAGDNVVMYFAGNSDNKGQKQEVLRGAGTITVQPGTWVVHHNTYGFHDAASLNSNGKAYGSYFLPMVPYHFAEGASKPEEIYSAVISAVKVAAPNQVLEIEAADQFINLSNDVFAEMAKRPDVTYRIHFTKDGVNYLTEIPAGADLSKLAKTKGVHGFFYVGSLYGITIE